MKDASQLISHSPTSKECWVTVYKAIDANGSAMYAVPKLPIQRIYLLLNHIFWSYEKTECEAVMFNHVNLIYVDLLFLM